MAGVLRTFTCPEGHFHPKKYFKTKIYIFIRTLGEKFLASVVKTLFSVPKGILGEKLEQKLSHFFRF